MPKPAATFEESKHYGGVATVRFYPKAHYYKVDDPEYPGGALVGERMGGATSLTGIMDKGMGLMLYPMYEATKYLRAYFRTTTVEEFCDSPLTMYDILKEATKAHTKKSDRGKDVGKDAHAWVEEYLTRLKTFQANKDAVFEPPEIPEVEDIAITLRRSYISIINNLKPSKLDDFRKLPKLIMQDLDIQEAIWTEATMLHKSTKAAKEWFDRHDVVVHGVEGVVYSRKLKICGSYDSDLTVTCTEKCGWCYTNKGATAFVAGTPGIDFTGRYIVDFKSTNASTNAPKGIYKEYLAQCGIYMEAQMEEFPDRQYAGCLILNGSKNDGTFSSHFSFNTARDRKWAILLSELREYLYQAGKEIESSL